MGLFDSLFGSKNKTKTSSQVDPWDEATKYLLGNDTTKGIFPAAQGQFATGGFTPQMDEARTNYLGMLGKRVDNPLMADFAKAGADLLPGAYDVARGAFDSNFGPVAGITNGNVNAPQTNLVQARQSQGRLDPTGALARMMSGHPDNPYLDNQASAITNQLTRNLNENVMPGVRSEALASGQYGGSRQGIAEGLAASRLNQDLAPALTNLYGSAYENAQGRMYGTANSLNDQAFQNATNNANRDFAGQQFNVSNDLSKQQFNANLGLQNNSQLMQKQSQNLGNRMNAIDIGNAGLGMIGGVNQMQDNAFGQQMSAYGMPQDINWQNINNYSGIMYPGAQLGNQSQGKSTQVSTPGIVPAIMGTVSGIAGLGRGMMGGGGGGFGSMFGGGR